MKLAKIVHLSTNDFGGAGSAALRYHEAFLALGYDSEMYVAESKSSVQDGRIKLIAGSSLYMKLKAAARKFFSPKLFSKLRQFLAEKERFSPKRKYLFFTTGESIEQGLNPRLVSAIEQADFLFVHWVAGFSSTHDVLEIHKKTGCKVYFVTMDMAHLTGGCHYYWKCRGFTSDCSDCPALDYKSRNYAVEQLRAKSINIAQMKASILCASEKILEEAKKSAIPYDDYIRLPIPINESCYTPRLRSASESVFKILTNANDASDPRKGFNYLLESLIHLDHLLTGAMRISIMCVDPGRFAPLELQRVVFEKFNYRRGDEELSDLYKSVSVFVNTSTEDAGPMMLAEALMCGIPVISFEVGMAQELIREGRNGFLISGFDARAVALKIFKLYTSGINELDQPVDIHQEVAQVFSVEKWKDKVSSLVRL
ncbi:glycosyltransferase [Pseudomonas sp. TH41]|uniref:glycosyltransferase n=1 Tax=Pseudomonas sp. TH41 TaxID=2796405 RepID=UPI00191378E3|nr:glycosyltransferase [Pseudomonas sp. TH41]MBK5355078.1 glycosyltransferase [Pseudomonas sp. TH41]